MPIAYYFLADVEIMETVASRLTKARIDAGFESAVDAATALGVAYPTYAAHKNGSRGFKPETAIKYARKFKVPLEWLMTGRQSGSVANLENELPYAGTVQAGVFLDVDLHTNDHPKRVAIAPDPRYRRAKQFAWLVRGDSMDRAGLLDGMWAVGVDYVDFADLYRDLESGDVVVVERLRFDGQERELTIKRFWREKDGIALVPDSSNPAHKAIVIPKDGEIVGEQIRILAYVTGAYTLFGKPVRDLDEG